ncbi:YbaB/EbfC family nucleoid-associated protein [Nocardia sp. CA-107356]|uniref:YbaB/EbfC family nucleoid-associated protein n=1 Tax=Nocardia sp. CA-107356 TaxID=3239972 RepID=UPI003D8B7E31
MSSEMDAVVAGAAAELEALETALHGLEQVHAVFTTSDGSVSAEVNSMGALAGLTLTDSVTSRPPAEVARLIIWAAQQAARDASDQRSEIFAKLNESFVPRSRE